MQHGREGQRRERALWGEQMLVWVRLPFCALLCALPLAHSSHGQVQSKPS